MEQTGSYWRSAGKYQAEFEHLTDKFTPAEGRAENLVGEVVRATNRLYYEFFNNGNCNAVVGEIIPGELVNCYCGGEDECCPDCGGEGCYYEEDYEGDYYISDFYEGFIKIIRHYFEVRNNEEGLKAVDTLRYNMELERDRVPESVYDNLVDIVTETILKDENSEEQIPTWYKN